MNTWMENQGPQFEGSKIIAKIPARIKLIAEYKLHAAPWLHFVNEPVLLGPVCDFEWLTLSYNVGQSDHLF